LAHPVRQYGHLMFTNTESLPKTKHNLTFRMGQKIKLQTRFCTFYISQCSTATQLRCGDMFSNHFSTNLSQNALNRAVKKLKIGRYLAKIGYGQNFVAYFFGPPCIFNVNNALWCHFWCS